MTEFPVYVFDVFTSKTVSRMTSFKSGPGRMRIGSIIAPEGAEVGLFDGTVPFLALQPTATAGRVRLYAGEAVKAAKAREYGLKWEPEVSV